MIPVLRLALVVGSFTVCSPLVRHWLGTGVVPLLLVSSLTGVTCALIFRRIPSPRLATWEKKALILSAIFALVSAIDLGIVFARQGYDFQRGATYFRPPLQNDVQRHVVIIEAMTRGNTNPLFADAALVYQTFWHEPAAMILGAIPGREGWLTSYHVIAALITLTGALFYFMLFVLIFGVRPTLLNNPFALTLIASCVLLHCDLFHMLASFVYQHRVGLEADWSFAPDFFRNFSPKLVALTAPQHAFFLFFLSAYFLAPPAWSLGFVVLAALASPMMAGFFFVPYVLARPKCLPELVLAALASVAISTVLNGFPPTDLLFRSGTNSLYWFDGSLTDRLSVLALWTAAAGALGLLATVLVVNHLVAGKWRRLLVWEMALLVPGALFFHYVATNLEIRRHYAILIGFVSLLLVAKLLPRRSVFKQEAWKRSGALFVTVMVAGHAIYLYAYLFRPSWMDTKLVFRPYFEANRVVREKYPDANILAASDALGTGLEYPPVMEAASSFSLSPHIRIHTKLSGRKWQTLQRAGSAKEMLPFGLNAGYEMVQWGPLEQTMWGDKVKRRFIDEKKRLLTVGEVGLYRLSDSYGEELRLAEMSRDKKKLEALGYRLQKEGWLYEAYEAFKLAGSREGAATVLEQSGFTNDAKRLRAGANQLPKLP